MENLENIFEEDLQLSVQQLLKTCEENEERIDDAIFQKVSNINFKWSIYEHAS